jgi:hypothetical protein
MTGRNTGRNISRITHKNRNKMTRIRNNSEALIIPAILLTYCKTKLNHTLFISTSCTPQPWKISFNPTAPFSTWSQTPSIYVIHSTLLRSCKNLLPASDKSPLTPFVCPVLDFLFNNSVEICNMSVSIIRWRTDWKHFNTLPITDMPCCMLTDNMNSTYYHPPNLLTKWLLFLHIMRHKE